MPKREADSGKRYATAGASGGYARPSRFALRGTVSVYKLY